MKKKLNIEYPIDEISYKEYLNLSELIIVFNKESLLEFGMTELKVSQLEEGSFYFGECRNSDLALWSGNKFHYIRGKFMDSYIEEINHKELEVYELADIFIPAAKIINLPYDNNEINLLREIIMENL